jgi:hypothetical protein
MGWGWQLQTNNATVESKILSVIPPQRNFECEMGFSVGDRTKYDLNPDVFEKEVASFSDPTQCSLNHPSYLSVSNRK